MDKKPVFKFCPICRAELAAKDIDGAARLTCPSCRWINYQNPVPVAVAAVVNTRREVLVSRRAFEPAAGQWSLPGGFVESGEHPEEACLRELMEETGIKGEIIRLVGVYSFSSRIHGSLLVMGYEVKPLSEELKLNKEVSEAKFVPYHDIPHITFASHVKLLQDVFKI
ncbi:NUDIX hydrolase [bacterium]|nr:NUDIX hydrolase [Candidatus Omnitrophota bacterium]MBU2527978.1 NUDIX hydrolase [bacterium]MBU3930127.1 NUDIX hydrolase [bacterium]MBU4122859.1 NUDIX hydrolase [bacterium]